MSSINYNTKTSRAGRSQTKYCSDNALALNSPYKYSSLDAVNDSDLKASLTKEERLQRENAKLKMELEGLRAQYHQLLEEKKDEVFDERRINLLKAQVMQLERQVVLLSEGLSSQMYRCLEVENAVETLTDRLRFPVTL